MTEEEKKHQLDVLVYRMSDQLNNFEAEMGFRPTGIVVGVDNYLYLEMLGGTELKAIWGVPVHVTNLSYASYFTVPPEKALALKDREDKLKIELLNKLIQIDMTELHTPMNLTDDFKHRTREAVNTMWRVLENIPHTKEAKEWPFAGFVKSARYHLKQLDFLFHKEYINGED